VALKLWSITGDKLVPSITQQCLTLAGDSGTAIGVHGDPVGAATLAIAVELGKLTAEQLEQLLRAVLARWMFASPRLFAEPRTLRLFLLLLRRVAELQQQYTELEAKREAALKVANRPSSSKNAKASKEAEADGLLRQMSALEAISTSAERLQTVRQELQQQQAQQEEQLVLQGAAVEQLTPQEAGELEGFFSDQWKPLPWLLLVVQGVMGEDLILIIDQTTGQCRVLGVCISGSAR